MASRSTKYSRSNFFGVVIDPNGEVIQDITSCKFSNIYSSLRNNRVRIHTVSSIDENALDLISFLEYDNDHQYWWIIGMLNKIQDPFTEIPSGTNLAIPSTSLIEAFYQTKKTNFSTTRVASI